MNQSPSGNRRTMAGKLQIYADKDHAQARMDTNKVDKD
jgi:hypothetical protein